MVAVVLNLVAHASEHCLEQLAANGCEKVHGNVENGIYATFAG